MIFRNIFDSSLHAQTTQKVSKQAKPMLKTQGDPGSKLSYMITG